MSRLLRPPSGAPRIAPALFTLLLLLSLPSAPAAAPSDLAWNVAPEPWPESLGNHRARVQVHTHADAVRVHLPWRRRDREPEKKNVIVVDLATTLPVTNRVPVKLSRESGDIVFQPATVPGEYAVYYLPFTHTGAAYFPNTVYEPPADAADAAWRERCGLTPAALADARWRQLPAAQLIDFQARTEFDRFDPMELIAGTGEVEALLAQHPDRAYLLFPEDRRFPIRMTDDLPFRWIAAGPQADFRGEAQPGEFYTFQIGVYAARRPVENLAVAIDDFRNAGGDVIPASAVRCLNLGGTNWLGRAFTKTVGVRRGRVQALWFGIQVPAGVAAGDYRGTLKFHAAGLPESAVDVTLKVAGAPLTDGGDADLWRQSRLRWLDSTIGLDDDVVPPYPPVEVEGNAVRVLGRTLQLAETGLPASLRSTFSDPAAEVDGPAREILAGPLQLLVEIGDGALEWRGGRVQITGRHTGAVSWESQSAAGDFQLRCQAKLECDGYINYALTLTASRPADLRDVRLEIPMRRDVARYMMGLGHKGGYRPAAWEWKWDLARANHRFWIGDINAGVHCKLKGPEDTWELYNLKNSGLPESWHNGGRGGCRLIEEGTDIVRLTAYTGPRRLEGKLELRFGLLATPVKRLDPAHWQWRYWHQYSPVEEVARNGANIINVHHANELNPFINYPFMAIDKLKPYVAEAHRQDIKVKLYYTLRELSTQAAELWAVRSLGDEIFRQGPGFRLADQFVSQSADKGDATTGNAWLCEHLVTGYVPAWHHPFGGGVWDAAIATTGLSRWHNHYLEGLAWLIRNVGIDGLYLDGIGYDREIMKRVRKVMDRTRPGCLIDFHCGNHFHPEYGLNSIVNQHLEHLPYIDSLWLGEGFNYDESPEYWLIELSGLPFGLFSEMLGVGNPWRGMLYGMSNRLPYAGGDPRHLWKLWDDFGIHEARLAGYWNPDCPVKTGLTNVLATAYLRPGQTLIALASWAPHRTRVTLACDWPALGLDPAKTTFLAPPLEHFQPAAVFGPNSRIPVEAGKGWLLIADETPRELSADHLAPDPLRGRQLQIEENQPLEIHVPANTVKTRDMPWAAGARVAVARIDPMRDNGQTWGLGLAVGWPDGNYVQIHHRSDGRWGVTRNGVEALLGSHAVGAPAILAISLLEDTIALFARETSSEDWDQIAAFPRREFPGTPGTIRVGKIGPTWAPQNFGEPGTTHPCRIDWVRQYH